MQRGHLHAGCRQRGKSGTQRGLQRAKIEHHALRTPCRELGEDGVARPQRCGHDDEVEDIEVGKLAPVIHAGDAVGSGLQIGDLYFKALRDQELHEPPAHLAGAADHQRPASAAGAVRGHAHLFLGGE